MLQAVIVGIDKFRDPNITDLSYARADAEAFANLIEDKIHPAERQVQLLVDEAATKRNITIAIGEDLPRTSNPDDLILLYFACHGSPEANFSAQEPSRFLIVHDTEFENIYATGIDMERDLPHWFERISQPKLILQFIDACFSGRAGGRTFEGPYLYRARAQVRGSAPISLRNLDLGEGRLMISACDDDQVAREDRGLGHGVFTHYMLEVLTHQDVNQNTISVHTLYEEVARSVQKFTNGRQVPVINGRSRFAQLPRFG
jgi:uncharacterized caspase-like protein